MRRVAVVVTAVAFALLGPRLTAPQDRRAGEPFVYSPPEGFIATTEPGKPLALDSEDGEWAHPAIPGHVLAPRVTLKRLKKGGNVEPADLAKIAAGMPGVLESNGVTWTDVRQETRARPDGARVGLIEGECTKKTEEMMTGVSGKVTYRRLLLVFPTDEGSALVTALYGKDEIAAWQPVFEDSILRARGVALRVPSPPAWMHLAWGGAGLVLGWLGASLLERAGDRTGKRTAKAKTEHEKEEEEEEA